MPDPRSGAEDRNAPKPVGLGSRWVTNNSEYPIAGKEGTQHCKKLSLEGEEGNWHKPRGGWVSITCLCEHA